MAPSADEWLAVCRRATVAVREMLEATASTAGRAVETGRGQGGDRTLVIDRDAEKAIFAELDALHEQGARFSVVSEERGEVDYGDPGVRLVIDPIDGSLNAKRLFPMYAFSFAVADGETMGDVSFGYVYDFGTSEEWAATRGAGATLNGALLDASLGERRSGDGRLELLGIESADPRWLAEVADDLVPFAHRVRAMGSIALTLCQVAAGRLDAMASLKRARAVDAAAAQLIVREAGGIARPLDMQLDTKPRAQVIAARTEATADGLAQILRNRRPTPDARRPSPTSCARRRPTS